LIGLQPTGSRVAVACIQQGIEETPATIIVNQMVTEDSGSLLGIDAARAPRLQMRANLIEGSMLAAKSTLASPVDEIRVAIALQQSADSLSPRSRRKARQGAKPQSTQLRIQFRGNAIPGRHHHRQQAMGEQGLQLAPALLQLLDDSLAPPLPSQFDGAFSFAGIIIVCVPVLQYRNSRVLFKLTRQCFPGAGRNDRKGQGHTAILAQGE